MTAQTATLTISRTSQYTNAARKLQLFIDGKQVELFRNGETKEIALEPGKHKVYAKVDWCKTRSLELQLKAGDKINLEMGSDLTGARMLLALYYTLFDTRNFIYLKEV